MIIHIFIENADLTMSKIGIKILTSDQPSVTELRSRITTAEKPCKVRENQTTQNTQQKNAKFVKENHTIQKIAGENAIARDSDTRQNSADITQKSNLQKALLRGEKRRNTKKKHQNHNWKQREQLITTKEIQPMKTQRKPIT